MTSEGPSKNEMKKLAKKAEKVAKKEQQEQQQQQATSPKAVVEQQQENNETSTTSSIMDFEQLLQEPRLNKIVDDIFKTAVHELFGHTNVPPLPGGHAAQACQNAKHGDFQCNAAMPTFAALKKTNQQLPTNNMKKPQDVARALMQAIGNNHPVIRDLSVSGPGFVLCRVAPSFLEKHVNAWLPSGKLPCQKVEPQTCVVDFSGPNIAKEMHVGHLRSTIIGESVCRILESVGHTVHRVNHVGDWGTQFGMLIQYLKEEYPQVGNSDDSADLPNIADLTTFYKKAKLRFDQSPEFKKLSQTNVVLLQSGDPTYVKLWKMLCDLSRIEFEKVYNRLDVTADEIGESFYNDMIPPVIDEFEAAGKITVVEGGAKCFFLEPFNFPLMLQKSDGGFGYDSTDMAALKYRLQTLKADQIIVLTDFQQGDHFKMVFAAGHDMGWVDKGQRVEHIGFGTILGEDGKRLKSRSGETLRLADLLDEAVSRMEESLNQRIANGKSNITADEVHSVAEAIGYGAIKYYDLRRNPMSNYTLSYDRILSTSGDTAVYLLFARVRLESIIAKAKAEFNVDVNELLADKEQIVIGHPSERNLVLHLQKFADTMELTLDDLFPCHICEYLYKLSIAASDFVTQCKVLGSPEMTSRLLLCHATVIAMHQCFDLLGIRHVQRI